jgi:hypothetical protein
MTNFGELHEMGRRGVLIFAGGYSLLAVAML